MGKPEKGRLFLTFFFSFFSLYIYFLILKSFNEVLRSSVIRRKPIRTEQRSGALYFIVYSVLTFGSVDEFPKYDNSNENYKHYFRVVRFILPVLYNF